VQAKYQGAESALNKSVITVPVMPNEATESQYNHRRARLRGWMADHKLTGREVAKACGWSTAAHVTNLLRGHSAFGEKVAREVERKLRMPEQFLDQGNVPESLLKSREMPQPSTMTTVQAVVALRNEMGPPFMQVTAERLEHAVRLVLANPTLVRSTAELLKN
jgi:transcriptional regulator with XRE-family HTH domain